VASRPIRSNAKQALDRRAASLFGPGATGLNYVLHWIRDRRSMVGLAHAAGADFGRPALSRACLWFAIQLYDGYAEQIAAARQQVAQRQSEHEHAAGLAEAPPAAKDSPFRPTVVSATPARSPSTTYAAPASTIDEVRCWQPRYWAHQSGA
jgi:hypothetical protein